MNPKILYLVMLVFVVNLNAQTPNWAMTNSNGGTDYDWGQSVASDAFGNIVVVGAFYSPTITFGSTVLTNPNAGKYTSFIVRYDINGNVIWAKQPITVGVNYNRASDVGIDDFNNIYISGVYTSATITFDTITLTKPNCCFMAQYIVKLNSSGTIIWAITTNGEQQGGVAYPPQPYSEPSPLNSMAINKNNGDVYLTGSFDSDSMYFGSTVLYNATTLSTVQYQRDIYIAKYDSSGSFKWARSIGGDYEDNASDIAVYNSNLFVTGSFNSSILNIGSTTLLNPNSNGSWDQHYIPFVAKYDSSGNPVWAKSGKSAIFNNSNRSKSIAADSIGNCYLTGEFKSAFIVFGNDTLFNTDTFIGTSKIFVVKYDSLGNVNWSKTFANGTGNDWALGIQTDGLENVYICGSVYSNALSIDSLVISFSGFGVFVVKLDSAGGFVWIKTPGGSNNQQKYLIGLSVSNIGNVFLTGRFNGYIYLGSDTLLTNGLGDIVTAVLLNCSPSYSTITSQSTTTFCQGDSVILSASPGYISYQWYRRNFAIPGATSMNYSAKSSGRYSCQSQNTTLCIDTSNIIVVNVPCMPLGPNQQREITMIEWESENFLISPNPGTGLFSIKSPPGQLQVFNSIGQLILSLEITDEISNFDMSDYIDGIYVVTLKSGELLKSQKIILSR